MPTVTLHPKLSTPVVENGNVVSQLVYDLTVYLVGPTLDEFDFIVDLYRRICPPQKLEVYATAETVDWDSVEDPILTKLGLEAEARGQALPFCEPVRQRIRDGRRFEFQFWDAQDHDSYSLNFRRAKLNDWKEQHSFVRFLFPLNIDVSILRTLAEELAENVELRSGHGGYCLSYNPWYKFRGFTLNYGRAKRWWGLDLEDLNGTLPLMVVRVKGPQWITILGNQFVDHPDVKPALKKLGPAISVSRHKHGLVLVAGDAPAIGDQHLPNPQLDPYFEVGGAIAAVTVNSHPDFDGEYFTQNGDTLGWFRRFIEPDGWR